MSVEVLVGERKADSGRHMGRRDRVEVPFGWQGQGRNQISLENVIRFLCIPEEDVWKAVGATGGKGIQYRLICEKVEVWE